MQSDNTNHPNASEFSEVQEKINEAELYLTQGLFDEARQIYQRLLDQLASLAKQATTDPGSRGSYESRRVFIQEQLAVIDLQESEFHGHTPKSASQKAAPVQKDEGSASFNRGQAFLDIGLFTEAIEEFQRAAKTGFQPIECSFQIGKAYIQLGRHTEGIQVLEKAYKKKGLNDTERNLLLGQIAVGYETAGDKEKALQLYQQLAERDPNHSIAATKVKSLAKENDAYNLNMVKVHLKNKQFAKAVNTLRLMESEKRISFDDSMLFYKQILRQDPENDDALERVSTLYRQMLDNGTGGVDIRLELARHFLRARKFTLATNEYLEVMLEDTPHKMTALNELGEAFLKRQEYDRILELLGDAASFVESMEPGPEVLNYYVLLGKACERKSMYDQAKHYFQRVAAIDPTHEAIKSKIDTQTQAPLLSRGKSLLGLLADEKLQYRIQEKIDNDGFHQIFKVSEVPSGTIRVAKTLVSNLSDKAKAKEFIVAWAYEQIKMENRNITRVLDVAESEGHYFLISEDFETTLDELLRKKTHLPLNEALELARALLNALAYAHSHRGTDDTLRKIFHLALNPKRVLIKGEVKNAKIADFGLVGKLATTLDFAPDYEELLALDLAYAAPEVFNRHPARMPDKMKQAADLYSFGLVFYRSLTGKLPFEGPSPKDFKKQHNEQYPVPPRVFISSIPAKLDEAILKCLRKDPKKRWRTPTELDLALEKMQR